MNKNPPVFYRTSSPSGPLSCFLSLQYKIMKIRASRLWSKLSNLLTTTSNSATAVLQHRVNNNTEGHKTSTSTTSKSVKGAKSDLRWHPRAAARPRTLNINYRQTATWIVIRIRIQLLHVLNYWRFKFHPNQLYKTAILFGVLVQPPPTTYCKGHWPVVRFPGSFYT